MRERTTEELLLIFLDIVQSLHSKMITTLHFIERNDRPGAYPRFDYDCPSDERQRQLLDAFADHVQLIRKATLELVQTLKISTAPDATVYCTVTRFGVGRCAEFCIEFIASLLPHQLSGEILQLAVSEKEQLDNNHLFLIYIPAALKNIIADRLKNSHQSIDWLRNIPNEISRQLILIDPWRKLVTPLYAAQLTQLIEAMTRARMTYLLSSVFTNFEKSYQQLSKIMSQVDYVYSVMREKIPNHQQMMDSFAAYFKANRNRNIAAPIERASALSALCHSSGLSFVGELRPNYTLDAKANITQTQLSGAMKFIESMGAGELSVSASGNPFVLFRGINVSNASRRPADPDDDALLDRIQELC